MAAIREYNSKKDKKAVIDLIKELQDAEKTFDPRIPTGAEVAVPYFAWMMKRCRKYSGKLFIAEDDGNVIGFISVLGRVKYTDPDDYPHEYALIEELVVRAPYRGRGLGRQLLSKAEEYVRGIGSLSLQLEVTAANSQARRLYKSAGFQEAWIELEKKLD
ncbi:MAG: GNAT family N-acetyltransferase [Dehalococcoidales bacterium]|nr:GNAT family N-acetyltransferase [Dehalococcoidales bacterium]